MRKPGMKLIAAMCAPLLAGGCAFFKPSPASVALAPLSSFKPGVASSGAEYQRGREFQDRYDLQKAIDSYRKAIRENPDNVEAHNALGVIYAMQGRNEQAVAELVIAGSLAPTAGHVQNNLGYAYLLAGRTADAMVTLQIAAGLDPANQRIRDNLRSAQAQMNSLRRPQERIADAVIASPAPEAELKVDPDAPVLVNVAPNVYELKQHLPRVAAASPVAVVTQAAPFVVKIEVANGNGVTGMAKRTSAYLQQRGYVVARLTNQLPYTQPVTQIQYRRGSEDEARRLMRAIAARGEPVQSSELNDAVGVRILLGRDAVEHDPDSGSVRSGALRASDSRG